MRTIAGTPSTACSWAAALAMALIVSGRAAAGTIVYSTSGVFNLATGPLELNGVVDAVPTANLALGTVAFPTTGLNDDRASFQLQFQFNDNLPAIDVGGAVAMLGYNFDEPAINPVVSTSATAAQVLLYPSYFRDLIAHPDWFHTNSFENYISPTLPIGASVHPEDPHEVRPIPEPSCVAAFGLAAAGMAWRGRRHRRGRS